MHSSELSAEPNTETIRIDLPARACQRQCFISTLGLNARRIEIWEDRLQDQRISCACRAAHVHARGIAISTDLNFLSLRLGISGRNITSIPCPFETLALRVEKSWTSETRVESLDT